MSLIPNSRGGSRLCVALGETHTWGPHEDRWDAHDLLYSASAQSSRNKLCQPPHGAVVWSTLPLHVSLWKIRRYTSAVSAALPWIHGGGVLTTAPGTRRSGVPNRRSSGIPSAEPLPPDQSLISYPMDRGFIFLSRGTPYYAVTSH